MYLNNPEKFNPSGLNNPLIGLQDIVIQYSTLQNPVIYNKDHWTNVKNYNPDEAYNWIKISFDAGETWSFIYKLNTSSISFNFNLNDLLTDKNNLDYPYYYRYAVISKSVYDAIKNKSLILFVGSNEETISFSAPIRYKTEGTNYYIDILFTEAFKTQFDGCTCYINS